MSLDLLDAPVRVSWDLHGENAPMRGGDAVRVASALAEAGVFFVTLDRRPLVHPELEGLLSVLAEHGCRIQVVCRGEAAELAALSLSPHIDTLFLDVGYYVKDGRVEREALLETLAELRRRGRNPDILLTPTRDNFAAIPALLDLCHAEGVGKFKLPNTRYDDSLRQGRGEHLLTPEDLRELGRLLNGTVASSFPDLKIEVHDLFIWELLYPDRDEGRSGYGGCQAGNSLAHVDAAGDLFPCSSWPEPLGSLLEEPLLEIWDSPGRHAVRRKIAMEPAGCSGCRDLPLCLGGCRGLAEALAHHCAGRDPLCAGPR